MAHLRVEAGREAGTIYRLDRETVVLGRHATCDVVLDTTSVSRQHAAVTASDGRFVLEDLRSRNRTFLNGEPIFGPVGLRDRDEIRIAEVRLTFWDETAGGRERPGADADDDRTVVNIGPGGSDGNGGDPLESSSVGQIEYASSGPPAADPDRKLAAVLQIGRDVSECTDVDSVLGKALDGLLRLFPNAARAIALWDEDDEKVRVRCWRIAGPGVADDGPPEISRTVLRQARHSDDAVLATDLATDVRFDDSASVHDMQLVSVMCVPICSADGHRYGFIEIDGAEREKNFDTADLDTFVGVAAQIGVAVRNAVLTEELLVQRDVRRDLEFAMQVQLGFLPNEPPAVDGYRFGDHYEAARHVGGDYFDYVGLPDGRIAMTIGDVAGKGMPAALLMARLFASARYQLLAHADPAEAMAALNREITKSRLGHRFITCLFAVVDPSRHTLSVINAGHPSLVVRTAAGVTEVFPQSCR
ncbi:MAG: SpoIIE family protein phosphatase, partial [Planctomycetota bacterium]